MTGVQQAANNPPSDQAIWWGCRQLGVGWDAQIMPDYAQGSFSPVAPAALTRALVLNVLVVAAAGFGLLMLLVVHCSPGRTTPLVRTSYGFLFSISLLLDSR